MINKTPLEGCLTFIEIIIIMVVKEEIRETTAREIIVNPTAHSTGVACTMFKGLDPDTVELI